MNFAVRFSALAIILFFEKVRAGAGKVVKVGTRLQPRLKDICAGAVINACLLMDFNPSEGFTVKFSGGSDHDQCMNTKARYSTVEAFSDGLTCGHLGYIESKASSSGGDLCATDRSLWSLSYKRGSTNGSVTASLGSGLFSETNWMELVEYEDGMNLCTTQDGCGEVRQTWPTGTSPGLYVSVV